LVAAYCPAALIRNTNVPFLCTLRRFLAARLSFANSNLPAFIRVSSVSGTAAQRWSRGSRLLRPHAALS
jgi:hypothetical protein